MPCDIDVPDVDVEKIKAWSWHPDTLRDIHNLYVEYMPGYQSNDFSEFSDAYRNSKCSGIYWQDHFAVFSLSHRRQCDTGRGRYLNEFDKHFPELCEFFDSLPTLGSIWRLGWLYYNDEFSSVVNDKDQYACSPIHIDEVFNPDFRLVINQTDPELVFYPWQDDVYDNIKSDLYYLDGLQNSLGRGLAQKFLNDDIHEKYFEGIGNPDYVKSDAIQSTFSEPNHVYMLNSRTAAHMGRYQNPKDAVNKLTFLCWKAKPFHPKLDISEQYDVARLRDMIDRSIGKYSKHIITRDGTNDLRC